jgi:hypothetical protein
MYVFRATTIAIVAATADLSPPSSRILPSCWTIGAGWPWLAMRAATSEEMARVSSLRVAGGQRVPSLSPPGISRGDPQYLKNNLSVDNFSQFFDLKKMISTHT